MKSNTTIRMIRTAGTASLASTLLLFSACASTPAGAPAGDPAAAGAPADPAQIEAANDSSTAIRGASAEDQRAYRDCVRRVMRTGSRLARSECESAIYGGGFHSMNESKTGEPTTINSDPR